MALRKNKKRKVWVAVLIIVVVLLASLAVTVNYLFRIKEINIRGSEKYTYDELYGYIFENRNDKNTLLYLYTERKDDALEIPFISKVETDVEWPGTLNITVYEKSIVGYLEYKGTNMYFDKDGVIVESSVEVFTDIPRITGLSFKSIVVHEKLRTDDEDIFPAIHDLTQYLIKYDITVDSINVAEDKTLSLTMGDVTVLLGGNDSTMPDKVYELGCLKESLTGRKGTLYLDEFMGNSQSIIFKEE